MALLAAFLVVGQVVSPLAFLHPEVAPRPSVVAWVVVSLPLPPVVAHLLALPLVAAVPLVVVPLRPLLRAVGLPLVVAHPLLLLMARLQLGLPVVELPLPVVTLQPSWLDLVVVAY